MPGGGGTTVYGTTSESGTLIVEGTSTSSGGSSKATGTATVVQANGTGAVSKRRIGVEDWLVGLMGLVLGIL